MLIEHVLYQAHVKATGGRDGRAVSSNGVLDVQLTTPRALGGAGRRGTNQERLFTAGYAASFLSAMQYVAARDTLAIPPEIWVEGAVGIGAIPQGFGIEVELRMALPGRSDREAEALVNKAHVVCPYANATRGNIACTWCSCHLTHDHTGKWSKRWERMMPRTSRNVYATHAHRPPI
jgi:Ohr subfamily peroxiredoxin